MAGTAHFQSALDIATVLPSDISRILPQERSWIATLSQMKELVSGDENEGGMNLKQYSSLSLSTILNNR